MSNLIATNYRPSATGFLPALNGNNIIETLTPASTTSISVSNAGLTTISFATGAAAGALTFTPTSAPAVGTIKEFIQMSTTALTVATITPGSSAVFIKGPSTSVASVALDIVLSQFARFQYVGVNGSGKFVYRLISTNGTVV